MIQTRKSRKGEEKISAWMQVVAINNSLSSDAPEEIKGLLQVWVWCLDF